jgi:hypothetical protein
MAVNATHPDYDAAALEWARARDVLAGEDSVKGGGEKYLPRLDAQTDEEFAAYVKRASYFNASARPSEAYLGLMSRRPPFVKLPDVSAGVGWAMAQFQNDADMPGTTPTGYAKMVVGDVVGPGRAGSLVDWEGGQPMGMRKAQRPARLTLELEWNLLPEGGRQRCSAGCALLGPRACSMSWLTQAFTLGLALGAIYDLGGGGGW